MKELRSVTIFIYLSTCSACIYVFKYGRVSCHVVHQNQAGIKGKLPKCAVILSYCVLKNILLTPIGEVIELASTQYMNMLIHAFSSIWSGGAFKVIVLCEPVVIGNPKKEAYCLVAYCMHVCDFGNVVHLENSLFTCLSPEFPDLLTPQIMRSAASHFRFRVD